MSIFDKLKHEGQNALGRAKQGMGRLRGDTPQANEGKRQQRASQLKKAGDHVKDAFKKR
ncbi:MAG TPA: CsbD family protein [Nocardioidaceae bacterium]|nr:CsbD family protein [Nocardioidaceae bacterium]